MSNYAVKLAAPPKNHEVPQLLHDFGDFVAKQKHGALGWFDRIDASAIPKEWHPEATARLRAHGFSFLELPEGSLLALLTHAPKAPAAVVLLGSEGDIRTVANSLEELLALWAKGETGIDDLDDEDGAAGRKALGGWLRAKKIKAPKVKADFDFEAWLDDSPAPQPAKAPVKTSRRDAAAMKALGPKLRQLAEIVGQSTAAPAVIEYITKTLGKKVPQKSGDNVSAPKAGIELACDHDVLRPEFPLIPKTAKTFVPYVNYAWVSEKFGEPVLGIPWNADEAAITKLLGKPRLERFLTIDAKPTIPTWDRDLGGAVKLAIQFRKHLRVTLSVEQASYLEEFPTVSTGLFLGWAATHGLLDEAQLAEHAELLAAVKKRKAKGSELLKTALPRGLWNTHLKDDPDLRLTAYQWFHNQKNMWITGDLKKVFGKREGKYGHDEPKLDDDTWEAVDKADEAFKARFAKWL